MTKNFKFANKVIKKAGGNIEGFRLLFLSNLDKPIQEMYKIDKKCEKNNSILNKTIFNGMIGEMNNLYSIYLCKRGNL